LKKVGGTLKIKKNIQGSKLLFFEFKKEMNGLIEDLIEKKINLLIK